VLIRKAFESTVEVLGESAKYALIQDLKYSGVNLEDPKLNLQILIQGLKELLGDEAAVAIIGRLIKKFDQLEYDQIKKK
jgi:hypothetical protein